MRRFNLLIFFIFCGRLVLAQNTANRLPAELVQFFAGSWKGEGKFASGRVIKANLTIVLSLDSCWLTATHEDVQPNRYKAMLIWGVDAVSGEFIAYNFDNFHGHRQFSSEGFHEQKLKLSNNRVYGKVKVWEQFIYEKLSENTFEMTYETSRDNITWKKIDSLLFYRQ